MSTLAMFVSYIFLTALFGGAGYLIGKRLFDHSEMKETLDGFMEDLDDQKQHEEEKNLL